MLIQVTLVMMKKIITVSLAMLSEDYSDNTSVNLKIKSYNLGLYKIVAILAVGKTKLFGSILGDTFKLEIQDIFIPVFNDISI